MNTRVSAFLVMGTLFCAGCAHDPTTARRSRATVGTRSRVVYTGSHIPQPRNQITPSPLSATTPIGSFSRNPDSLVPTEPVVGATNNATPNDDTGPSTSSQKVPSDR